MPMHFPGKENRDGQQKKLEINGKYHIVSNFRVLSNFRAPSFWAKFKITLKRILLSSKTLEYICSQSFKRHRNIYIYYHSSHSVNFPINERSSMGNLLEANNGFIHSGKKFIKAAEESSSWINLHHQQPWVSKDLQTPCTPGKGTSLARKYQSLLRAKDTKSWRAGFDRRSQLSGTLIGLAVITYQIDDLDSMDKDVESSQSVYKSVEYRNHNELP